tara:strand:+ start:797 stop:1327 length:531 start_codon:yes stop_codon:yes gene_type:complete
MGRARRVLNAVLFIIIGILFGSAKCYDETYSRAHEETNFYWLEKPRVIVCYPNMPMHYLHRGLEWWAIRGHEVESVTNNPNSGLCQLSLVPNTIIIRRAQKDELEPSKMAITRRFSLGAHMAAAEIVFREEHIHRPLIVEHELGHAFGYTHVKESEKGHIMNPWYEDMGQNFWPPK